MAADVKLKYGTSNQPITITLNSLAASATVGRQGTAVDNSTNVFMEALVQGAINVGVVSGNKQILIFVASSADGGTNYSGKNGANAIGASDAGFTRVDPTDLRLLGVLAVPTASVAYTFGPYPVAQAFGGVLPDHWVLVIFNDSGVALAASGNSAWYQGVYAQTT